MSTIQFSIEIWGSSSQFHLLEKLQKQGIRLIKAKKYVIHTSGLFKELKILPLSLIREQRERCLAFKYNEMDIFEKSSSARQQEKLQIRLPLQLGQKQVYWRICNTWNQLSEALKSSSNLKILKEESKKELFCQIPDTVCTYSRCPECSKT